MEALEFYSRGSRFMLNFVYTRICQKVQAVSHRWTYQEIPSPKNVVVLGGSYSGVHLAQRLTETLPTGYRAVLVERNSHFNHLFVFPRFGVVPGMEQGAFIPYGGIATTAPRGIFQHIQDSAVEITPTQVQLASGKSIDYEYLAVATGSWQPAPAKLTSTEKADACAEMRASQHRIQNSSRIAVIGGGPVGVQVATDIKSYFPQKDVTLIHSRHQLLPNFGPRLHEFALQALKKLQVNTVLGQRPKTVVDGVDDLVRSSTQETLAFQNGRREVFDLVIRCTGQRPNSGILAHLYPSAVCKSTGQILVRPTLQIDAGAGSPVNPHLFALGDVAKTGAPRMERAARSQADVVTSNILSMINGQSPSAIYRPVDEEGVIKLTLGKYDWAMYFKEESGRELMVNGTSKSEDLDVRRAWINLGAKYDPST
ncbi:conserved hypothetical protein [Uncinocarpus reesii 1704]|uniref:FAD/NAD(P)-binding domain-containing protein n=1 Tax=Uncinocarpus reesii (strain UAMH 1704) TaxID=336963 RepID=C4JJA2_UNCRE|nr:uncharacterized protein UREG_01709 [Uncinocarpus reesii 1704]EEP76860.1 conserved hypothetical protein [Uncinocarpus reesii 1704]